MRNLSRWLSAADPRPERLDPERSWRRDGASSWRRPPATQPLEYEDQLDVEPHAGHLLVTASRICDAPVFDRYGRRVGRVLDVSIEKTSGQVRYVLLATGGFLGFGQRIRPLPWGLFTYALHLGGYVMPLARAQIDAADSLGWWELEWCGAGTPGERDRAAFYCPYLGFPFA